MEFRYLVSMFETQSLLEQIRKESVVPIPISLGVKRNNKQIGLFQGVQHPAAVLLLGDGIAEGAGQTRENGSLQQETLQMLGLTAQHLFH